MIEAIVTDIEGTTSSLSFVKDVLFPYARAHLPAFVRAHQQQSAVSQLLQDAQSELELGASADLETLIGHFIRWIDEDRKITPLKSLQGLIWQDGYDKQAFTGHIYPDAVAYLQAWHQQGLALYVYSSGSVQAQKLLFAHSDAGDLTPLFTDYFDTHIGGKRESESYRRIVERIGRPAAAILFLSDIKEELDAARQAGMQTIWLVRDGTPDPQAEHRQVKDFSDITVA